MPTYLHKLWAKGVDIGAGAITSVLVGLIGLLLWRGKLWLDLKAEERKQRQQHRIAEEFEIEKRRQEAKDTANVSLRSVTNSPSRQPRRKTTRSEQSFGVTTSNGYGKKTLTICLATQGLSR